MELITNLFEYMLHLDVHLQQLIAQYGVWTHLILFTIIFVETGVVIMPFLPGDSLLFMSGALAASGALKLPLLIVLLIAAAILGDTVNYWIGNYLGARAFDGRSRFFKPAHLKRTEAFFEKYGGKTIILARFVPIVRTVAPFVAGMGSMSYGRFLTYNVLGGAAWVLIFLLAGYFFGGLPVVQENFSLVLVAVIFLSLVPIILEVATKQLEKYRAAHTDSVGL